MRVCIAVAMLVVAAACTPEPEPTRRPVQRHPTRLVYVDGSTLRAYELDTGADEVVAQLPSADVALSPMGSLYVVVEETSPRGPGPEGFRDPRLVTGDLNGQEVSRLGPGRSPLFSPDGQRIAALAPAPGQQGLEVAVTYRSDGSGGEIELEPGRWALLGWTNHRAIGAIALDRQQVIVTAADRQTLDFPPNEVWGLSPTQPQALVVATDGSAISLVSWDGSDRIDVELPTGTRLGDGTWSPNGDDIAAVTVTAEPSQRLVLIDAATGDATEVPGSRGAQGQVVWGSDGSFAYARVDPGAPGRLEALYCKTLASCDPLFSWREGIRLIGLAP